MKKTLSFEKHLAAWLDECLQGSVHKSVQAFSFGISERELCFAVELNGCSDFDAQSDSWTWSEIWQPDTHKFTVPAEICCSQPSICSRKLKAAILHYLEHGVFASKLRSASGIAIENMEEGYELIWTSDRYIQMH